MLTDVDVSDIVQSVIGAQGDIALAAERLRTKSNIKITEYDICEAIASDQNASDMLMRSLRTLATIKLFDAMTHFQNDMLSRIDDMRASDVARTFTSLMTAFASISAPAAKVQFDYDFEAQKAATELNLPVRELQDEVKKLIAASKK